MKKFYTFALAAAGAVMAMSAQSKLDAGASLYVSQAQENNQARRMAARNGGSPLATTAPEVNPDAKVAVMVCMKTADDIALLEQMGFEVQAKLGRIATVMLSAAEMEQVAALDQTVEVSTGYGVEPTMVQARKLTGVDQLHTPTAGSGLSHSYTGEGVVVGLMDTGLDVGHKNFRDDNGDTRIKKLWIFQGTKDDGEGNVEVGTMRSYLTKSEIDGFINNPNGGTDTDEGSHATHVLGIMAGSYNKRVSRDGGGNIAQPNATASSGTPDMTTGAMPYYGVARNADIAACCGTLHEPCIVTAAQSVLAYAQEQGKPAVFNLSLGNNIGPHDGSDNSSEALAEAGKNMLICISAGNEGGTNLWVEKKFSGSDNALKTCISGNASAEGMIDIWADKADALKVSLIAVDASGKIVFSYPLPDTGGSTRYVGGTGVPYSNVSKDQAFNAPFSSSSYIGYRTNLNVKNNRYNVSLYPHLKGGSNGNYAGLLIEGTSGNGANLYAKGIVFTANGLSGFSGPSGENTINGMACGDNLLVVGSYVSGARFAGLTVGSSGKETASYFSYNGAEQGQLSGFSSSGHTFAGRQLPDVVGPGQGVVSSYNKYYVNKRLDGMEIKDEGNTPVSAYVYTTTDKKTRDYWAEMSGTSMSSPFVAGVLALWSQAAAEKGETLDINRVKEIIAKTADHDKYTSVTPERWGMGKINALAGLKEILNSGALNSVGADDPAGSMIVENLGGKQMNVFVGGTDGFTARLYNLQGGLSLTCASEGNNAAIDASSLADGIYLLEVSGDNFHTSRKIVVK